MVATKIVCDSLIEQVAIVRVTGSISSLLGSSGTCDGTVLQNIYSVDIVSCLAKSAEQIMNLYTFLYSFVNIQNIFLTNMLLFS